MQRCYPPYYLWLSFNAVVCNYLFVTFAKIGIMIWQSNKMQVSCVKIHCLWLHPVAIIWFARIHHSQINTTNQSQGECLRSVNHSCPYAAGSLPPSCSANWAVPLPHNQAQTQTLNNGGEQTTAEKCPHHSPCQWEGIKVLTEKSSVKTKNWTEPERKLV